MWSKIISRYLLHPRLGFYAWCDGSSLWWYHVWQHARTVEIFGDDPCCNLVVVRHPWGNAWCNCQPVALKPALRLATQVVTLLEGNDILREAAVS